MCEVAVLVGQSVNSAHVLEELSSHCKMLRQFFHCPVHSDVKTVQFRLPGVENGMVGGNRVKDGGCERRVHLLVELEVEDANAVAVGTDLIPLRSRLARYQSFAS